MFRSDMAKLYPDFLAQNIGTERIHVLTGCCPNPSSMFGHRKRALFVAQNLFSTILQLGFTANPKLALRAQTVGFAAVSPR
jgi:hypothetical protein